MRGLGQRLKARARELALSDAEVARRAGVSARAYSNYVNDEREPDYGRLLDICRALETTPGEVLGWHGGGGAARDEGLVLVPAFDVRASAGPGAFFEREQELYRMPFRRQWLRGLTQAAPDQLAVMEAHGDSMESTIHDGDSMLLDRAQINPRRDGIYVVRWDDLVNVKRITADPARRLLTVASDNPRYSPVPEVRPETLAVLGRVIWIGRRI